MDKPKKSAILYVDDEDVNLMTFAATFRRYYNVFTANSGAKGVEILQKEAIELIITDQRMPEMTGVQFLEAVIPEFPDIIRMILTGFSDLEDIIRAINTGRIYRYVTKPWNDQELKLYIDMGLNLYQLQKHNQDLIVQLNEELARKDEIMNLFKKYVPESILQELLSHKNIDSPITQGENRIISILFLDIRNFTPLTEKLNAKLVLSVLNDFFTMISSNVKKHKGSVNKFLGDGAMVFFGAPISSINNPLNAVLCGLNILEEMPAFSEKWKEKVQGEIHIGIGIATGEVVVGNMGSEDRIEYSAIGDSVNVASRIQELTKEIPNSMLISESTYTEAVKESINVLELEPQVLKGKEEKAKIYRIIGRKASS